MAVNLHLVGLTIVVTLNHLPGMINIFSVLMPNVLHKNSWRIWPLRHFFKISWKFNHQVLIPLLPDVKLVVDNYSESFGMLSPIYNWLDRLEKLQITIWGDANENLPVFWDWMWLRRLINYLFEVKGDSVVVPSLCMSDLMQHLFAFEYDGAS